MSSNQLTILDFRNILKWYETAKNKDDDEQFRSYLKIEGLLAINEDLCEPIIHDLIETVMSGLHKANHNEIQFATSLLKTRMARLDEELKIISITINAVKEKIEDGT
jgi:hypothetical protein